MREDWANLAVRRGWTGNVAESGRLLRPDGGLVAVVNPELGPAELRCGDDAEEVPLLSIFLPRPN